MAHYIMPIFIQLLYMSIDIVLVSTLTPNYKVKFPTVSMGIQLLILSAPLFLSSIFIVNAEAHKLIETPHNNNTNFETALKIPNHTVSWAIYQGLEEQDNVKFRFYEFDNKEINSSFYAQISIPKIEKYLNFTPSLYLIGPVLKDNSNDTFGTFDNFVNVSQAKINNKSSINLPFDMPQGYQILKQTDYNGTIPSPTFYEPFTQTSYWERQEMRIQLLDLGTYYVIVSDDRNTHKSNSTNNSINEGKFSLAVGEKEDFSLQDYLILLPYSWIKLKLFFDDYLSVFAAVIGVVFLIIILPAIIILNIRKKRNKAAN